LKEGHRIAILWLLVWGVGLLEVVVSYDPIFLGTTDGGEGFGAAVFQFEVFGFLGDAAADVIEEVVLELEARGAEGMDELFVGEVGVVVDEGFVFVDGNAEDDGDLFFADDLAELGGDLIWALPAGGIVRVAVAGVVETVDGGVGDDAVDVEGREFEEVLAVLDEPGGELVRGGGPVGFDEGTVVDGVEEGQIVGEVGHKAGDAEQLLLIEGLVLLDDGKGEETGVGVVVDELHFRVGGDEHIC